MAVQLLSQGSCDLCANNNTERAKHYYRNLNRSVAQTP